MVRCSDFQQETRTREKSSSGDKLGKGLETSQQEWSAERGAPMGQSCDQGGDRAHSGYGSRAKWALVYSALCPGTLGYFTRVKPDASPVHVFMTSLYFRALPWLEKPATRKR